MPNKICKCEFKQHTCRRIRRVGSQKNCRKYPLLILRLTRLAVDKDYQQKGIGKTLLKWVLKLTLKQKEQFGCFGLAVDARAQSVGF